MPRWTCLPVGDSRAAGPRASQGPPSSSGIPDPPPPCRSLWPSGPLDGRCASNSRLVGHRERRSRPRRPLCARSSLSRRPVPRRKSLELGGRWSSTRDSSGAGATVMGERNGGGLMGRVDDRCQRVGWPRVSRGRGAWRWTDTERSRSRRRPRRGDRRGCSSRQSCRSKGVAQPWGATLLSLITEGAP